jgi:hypothetical protein
MSVLEQGELRVEVPVGFLLQEEQEVELSVKRPDGRPLPIRIRLIPARPVITEETTVSDDTPMPMAWPTRKAAGASKVEDGYPTPEYGGSD